MRGLSQQMRNAVAGLGAGDEQVSRWADELDARDAALREQMEQVIAEMRRLAMSAHEEYTTSPSHIGSRRLLYFKDRINEVTDTLAGIAAQIGGGT